MHYTLSTFVCESRVAILYVFVATSGFIAALQLQIIVHGLYNFLYNTHPPLSPPPINPSKIGSR